MRPPRCRRGDSVLIPRCSVGSITRWSLTTMNYRDQWSTDTTRAPHSAVAVETTRGLTQMAEMWQMGARLSGRSLSSSAIISILHLSPSLFHFRLKAYFFGKILHHRLLVASGLSFTDSVWTRSFAWRFLFFFCSFFVFFCGYVRQTKLVSCQFLSASYRIVSYRLRSYMNRYRVSDSSRCQFLRNNLLNFEFLSW